MPGIAPSYRIGPSDFFTSGDLEADAGTLNTQIGVLDGLSWDRVSEGLWDQWIAFLGQWKGWHKSTFVDAWFGAGWNNSNRDQLIQFERRYLAIVAQWERESGQAFPGGVIDVSTGTQDTLGDHLTDQLKKVSPGAGAIGFAGLILAILVVVFLWQEFA